jgi:O-antigen/teichoic acid export membrane protein
MKEVFSFRKFLRNAGFLSLATIISQGVGFVSLPLLGRIYDPTEFGVFASFSGLSLFIGLFATLKYEKAIILPNDDAEGKNLVLLNILLIVLFSTLSIFIGVYGQNNTHLILLPLAVIAFSALSVLRQWLQREENFSGLAKIIILQSSVTLIASLTLGFFGYVELGLIIGYVLGACLPLFVFGGKVLKFSIASLKNMPSPKNTIYVLIKKYRQFPQLFLPYILVSSGLLYLLPIILKELFGEAETGFYSMSFKVLMVPHVIITFAFVNVFLVEANKANQQTGSFDLIYRKVFFMLLAIGIPVYLVAFLFGADILILVLGDEWLGIEKIFQALCPWMFCEFISNVFKSNSYIIKNKQGVGLAVQLIGFLIGVFTLFYTSRMGSYYSILYFSLVMSIFSLSHLIVTYQIAKTNAKDLAK